MSTVKPLSAVWTLIILILVGCTSTLPTPTASAPVTPLSLTPAPTDTQTVIPVTATSTTIPTAVPTHTPPPVTGTSPPIPSATPAPPPALTATGPPTPHPVSGAPIPRPVESISPDNALNVAHLGRWASDTRNSEVLFAHDGQLMAVTSSQGVHLFDVETLQEVGFLGSDGEKIRGLAFTPDGQVLAVGSLKQGVHLWGVSGCASPPSGECGASLGTLGEGGDEVKTYGVMAFSSDGEMLAAESTGDDVALWQVETGERLYTIEVGQGILESLAFSAGDRTLLSGAVRTGFSGGTVRLWDVESGELLSDLTRAGRRESRAAFSPDGTTLAAVGDDEKVSLWQTGTGMPLRRFVGHTERTRCVAFSPDGAMLATGAGDETIRLWRVSDGALLHTLEATVLTLAFSPDGAWLVSTGRDAAVDFWGIDPSSPPRTPVPTPTYPPRASATGAFTPVSDLPAGEIRQIWFSPEDQMWLASETGIFIRTQDGWRQVFDGLANDVLGPDGAGRIWATVNEGWRIGAFVDGSWTFYNPDQGWTRAYGRGLVTDRQGRVWLSTGGDLRRFDPEAGTWSSFSAEEIGFPPLEELWGEPLDPGRSLTDIALDSAGNIWVGSCTHSGIVIMGDGVRWFDGQGWSGSEDTAGECVYDIDVDDAGRVWMSGFDALIQYDPAAGAWTRFPLPPWERRQLINSVAIDVAGHPWVNFTRFGGAGPWHSDAIYRLEDEDWVAEYDPGIDLPIRLALGPDGTAWACGEGGILRLSDGQPQPIDAVGWCRQITVDKSGRVWVSTETGLWWFEP